MSRRLAQLARLLAIPSLFALGAIAAPAASAGNPCFHDFTMPAATTGSGNEVKLMPCAFEPTVTQVAVGSEVTFFNGPEFAHLITGANQAWGSPDVELAPNKSISYTFDAAGVYPYACVLHPGMSGAIVVGDLAQGLAPGTTNASAVAPAVAPEAPPTGTLVLIALGIGAGVIAGAAAAWLALRRRSTVRGTLARAD